MLKSSTPSANQPGLELDFPSLPSGI